MKKKILLGIAVVSFMMIGSSCLKDNGNYTYTDINDIEISGIELKSTYEVFAFIDTLKITPEIEAEDVNNASRYSYEWKIMGNDDTADSLDYVVSTDRNLELPVRLNSGGYSGYYKVTDNKEGTSWGAKFNVLVKTLTNEGYMVLCEEDGQGRMDIVASVTETEYKVAHNIWQNENYNMGKPKAVFFNYNLNGGSTTYYTAEAGTFALDKNLLTDESRDFKWSFGEVPDKVTVLGMNSTTFSNTKRREVLVNDQGHLYARSTSLSGSIYEYPINKINGTVEFEPSKHIGMPIPNSGGGYYPYGHTILIYDNTNKQFLELIDKNEFPTPIKFSNTTLFPSQTGRDIVHAEGTLNKYTFAVLKDPANEKFFIYGMSLGANAVNSQVYYMEVPVTTSDKVNHFAFHPLLPYLFYSTDHKVFQFDYSQPTIAPKEVLNYPNAKIAVLKYFPLVGWNPYLTWERDKALMLFVGRNQTGVSEDPGIIELYTAPPLAQALVKKHVFDGFGKIVDMDVRER